MDASPILRLISSGTVRDLLPGFFPAACRRRDARRVCFLRVEPMPNSLAT